VHKEARLDNKDGWHGEGVRSAVWAPQNGLLAARAQRPLIQPAAWPVPPPPPGAELSVTIEGNFSGVYK
jgi:hypothetical protein